MSVLKNEDEAAENCVMKSCEICCEKFEKLEKFECCSYELCLSCYVQISKNKPQCPKCRKFYDIPKGTQPENGIMTHEIVNFSLPGRN